MDSWNPEQYDKFKNERSQPFFDLMSLVETQPKMRVLDAGCGTGELTGVLHKWLEARETVGVDNSLKMLEKAGLFAKSGLSFRRSDIDAATLSAGGSRVGQQMPSTGGDSNTPSACTFSSAELGTFDLVFSNAALQWVPNHERQLEHLRAFLVAKGQIAIQMPDNNDSPSHVVASQLGAEPKWRKKIKDGERAWPVLTPLRYAEILAKLGFKHQNVRLQVYVHWLPSREDVVEWVKGTMLSWYQARLSPQDFDEFVTEYKKRLWAVLPDQKPFFYPFKRILFWGRLS